MAESNSDIIIKIKKVLALANDNPSVEEGQTAMLLAQKMMAENSISMAEVNTIKNYKKEVIDQVIEESSKSAWWHQSLSTIIADNFKCFVYTNRKHIFTDKKFEGVTSIKFVGLKDDVELAKEVYLYAIEIITYNYKNYVKQNSDRLSKKGIKNSYIWGFLDGLRDKFAEQVKNNSWGLIIVKDPEVMNAFKNLRITIGGKRSVHMNASEQDKNNGYKDGKNFQYIAGKLE